MNDSLSYRDAVVMRLRSFLRELEVSCSDNVPISSPLFTIGIDSLKFIKLIVKAEEAFEIEFPDIDLDPKRQHSLASLQERILTLHDAAYRTLTEEPLRR